MKEKINLLSKGIFDYGYPDVHVSEMRLDLDIEAGRTYSGEFEVYSTNGAGIRAKIFSSNKQMHCEETDIIGTDNVVHYVFSAENMETGDTAEGQISIISNGGEIQIPYKVTVRSPYCMTSIGEVGNLEEFTQLASENWLEALNLFKSRDFSRVFLVNKIHAHMYEKFMHGRNVHQAMEEFLYTLKKKQKVSISVTQREILHHNLKEPLSDKLVLEKDYWGYQEIFVRAEGDFLSVYKKRLTTQDFLGSYYELEYYINPDYLNPGYNYGKIFLKTFNQSIEIQVTCEQDVYREEENTYISIKKSVLKMNRQYLNWLDGKADLNTLVREIREDVDGCRNHSDYIRYAMYEAHFLFMIGDETNAKEILLNIKERELRKESLLDYSYYLYITTLYRKEADYVHFVVKKLRELYETQCDRWEVLWLLLQVDERLKAAGINTYKLIKAEFNKRCRSPFMYREALIKANESPVMIRELDAFEIQLLNWGVCHQVLTQKLIYQYASLAVRERTYAPLVLRAMMKLYDAYETKELLMAVCTMLIKGHKIEKSYNHWYLQGILQSLKVTRLYEYYMMSLDMKMTHEIPTAVLYFFNYNNQLEWIYKAFLYRYIIQNKNRIQRIFDSYDNIMKAYTFEQLSLGNIDENLIVLYKYYVTKDRMNSKLAKELPDIMFKHQVTCTHPGIMNVIVTMREINKEFVYPIVSNQAYVDIFMDEYNLMFEDADGNRYMRSIDYSLHKLMDDSEFIKECYELYPENAKVLMNRSERALKYQLIDDTSVEIFKRTLKIGLIQDEYRKNILKNLIDIYYENYEGETLEKYLLRLDIHLLGHEERGSIIEYYIQRGFYDKAYEAICEYGYEGIRDKRLMRLISRIIRRRDFEEDSMVLELAFHTFQAGKYDEVILEYLNRYYLGSTIDYLEIFAAANGFEVEVHALEEKMLCQVLFTEDMLEESHNVFESYYHAHPNMKIARAYLIYYAYGYLMERLKVKENIFHYMEIEMDQMGRGRDICSLAKLKHLAECGVDQDQYSEWIRKEIRRFVSKGIMLPWFKFFMDHLDIPRELLDREYIIYLTKPSHSVKIRYRIDRGEHVGIWKEENMQKVYDGIFVKSWPLFADEKLMWQALDFDGEDIVVTESKEIVPAMDETSKLITGVDYINRMIMQRDFMDYEAFYRTAKEYSQIKTMAEFTFDIL